MSRLDVIKEPLARYTDEKTNTDQKLENGAIWDWTFHSDDDTAWLVQIVEDSPESLEDAMRWIGSLTDWEGAGDPDVDKWRAVIAKAKGEQS